MDGFAAAVRLPLSLELKRKKCWQLYGMVGCSPTMNSMYAPFDLGTTRTTLSRLSTSSPTSYVRNTSRRKSLHFSLYKIVGSRAGQMSKP
jgi:hypothetical protein